MELRRLQGVIDRVLALHRGRGYHAEIRIKPNPMGDYTEIELIKSYGKEQDRGTFQMSNTEVASTTPAKIFHLIDSKIRGMYPSERGYELPMKSNVKLKSPVDDWLEEYDRRNNGDTYGQEA